MCSIDIHISFGGKTDIPPEIIGMFVGEHTQPAYNVGMTLIISCIYVATSNNVNVFSASGHRRHKDVEI